MGTIVIISMITVSFEKVTMQIDFQDAKDFFDLLVRLPLDALSLISTA